MFSGGKEWFCYHCEASGLYGEGEAPRRVQMLATPEGRALLREEMGVLLEEKYAGEAE